MLLKCGVGEDSWESLGLTGKDPDAGRDWGQEEKGTTEDEMAGWHHRLDGHEFWVNSRSWWWTGRPGVLRFIGSQRVRHNWATELNWTEPKSIHFLVLEYHQNYFCIWNNSIIFLLFCNCFSSFSFTFPVAYSYFHFTSMYYLTKLFS